MRLYSDEAIRLREEQDREYKEAEEKDRQERLRKEKEEEEKLIKEAEKQQTQELNECLELSKKLTRDAQLANKRALVTPEPADSSDTATVRFMLPKSFKLTRRFLRGDTVETINNFLFVHFADNGSGVVNFTLSTHSKQELNDPTVTLEAAVSEMCVRKTNLCCCISISFNFN